MTDNAPHAIPARDPADYFTLPVEAMTLVDLTNAIGTERTQALFETSRGNVRVLRHRKHTSAARMEILHAAFRENEAEHRARLVTLYTGQAARRQPTSKEPTA